MTYKEEITKAMTWLGNQPNTIFVGQSVEYPGTFMHDTLSGVPDEKKLEFPVAESFQMQFCMGLAMAGYIPICIFPRQNFMLHAIGDKLDVGKVIIRVASGTTKPIYPGIQHCGDYQFPISEMICNNCFVKNLWTTEDIQKTYEWSFGDKHSHIMCEVGDMYVS